METRNRWLDAKRNGEWTTEVEELTDCVEDNEELFEDMLFSKGTISYSYIAAQSPSDNEHTWSDDDHIPSQLTAFSYQFFDFRVEKIDGGFLGGFNSKEQSVRIDPDYLRDEPTILHEMIHLHEFVLNELPMFYHDAYFYCLYKSLKNKIADLDVRIEDHGHWLNQEQLRMHGGEHDILFLLKSFDLDLRKGYKLGTVFGYGYIERQTRFGD
ncbi:MAG: hypothetical protein LUC48_00735 [Clostridiales bacterium]|nr:hypothetical protein [Clostridiales bacterium]